jgi:2-amino-4-hydroxy-6-hydroxymethyldihydropteridine diphosphokinase
MQQSKLCGNAEWQPVYFSIGSNQGDRSQNLQRVLERFRLDGRVCIEATSSIYETSPVGVTEQPDFLNAVIRGKTILSPLMLLEYVKEVEKNIGRQKTERWGPRIIDIDILFYADLCMETEHLTIPHREVVNRAFVLIPLAEISPGFVFPDGTTVTEHMANLPGVDKVLLRKDIFLTLEQ